ncbi:MAG TPA: MFS transporter, partial [Symbiobacteriaceae bacterium]|nr:MFS transporter [Symbiobacteriaceae bacterium]
MRAIIHVLVSPGIARLFLAQFLISGQIFLAFSTLSLYTEQLGGNAWITGVHTAIFTGLAVLLRFFLGPLADAYDRKLPLLLGAFVFATSCGFLLVADNLFLLGLIRAYQGIGLAAYPSASTALLLDLSPPESRGVALSLYRGMSALALLVFSVGGEQLLDRWGYSGLFLVGGALATLAFFLVLSLREAASGRDRKWISPVAAAGLSGGSQQPAFSLSRVLRNFAEVGRRPAVVAIVAAASLTVVTYLGATSFLPLWSQQQNGGDIKPFFLALGTGAFLAGFAGGAADRYGPRSALLAALAASAAGAAFLCWRPSGPVLLLSGALVGIGYTTSMAAGSTWIDRIVPRHVRATAMAFTETGLDTMLS